jgi:hypothetical protein
MPIWRPIRAVLEPDSRGHRGRAARVPRTDSWDGPPPRSAQGSGGDARIRVISEAEFEAVAATDPSYYRGRRGYISAAARVADDLIATHGLTTAVELGPHVCPIIVGGDVIERRKPPGLRPADRLILHDARVTPWPIEPRSYDLFIALQVFEHLGERQAAAFLEVRRVARHAIISLPIDWVMADPTNSHHQLSHERVLSWFAPVVPNRILEASPAPRRRVIYVFEDLPPA